MRYAKIYDQLWENPDFLGLSVEAKLGYTYLCSCSHCNQIGFFRLPLAYIAADMGIKVDAAARVVKELKAAGFVRYNPDTSRMLILSYLKWNGSTSPKNVQGMADIFDQLPGDDLDAEFVGIVERYGIKEFFKRSKRACNISVQTNNTVSACDASSNDTVQQSDGYHIDTVSIEYRTQKQEQKQEQKQDSSLRSLAPSCDKTDATSTPDAPTADAPCSRPDDSQDALVVLPCTGGKSFAVTRGYLDGVQDAYPGVDLLGECRRAKVWLDANPKRRKTLGGMKSFLASWFAREQNHGGRFRAPERSALPDSVIHTEEAWAGQKGGKLFGGEA